MLVAVAGPSLLFVYFSYHLKPPFPMVLQPRPPPPSFGELLHLPLLLTFLSNQLVTEEEREQREEAKHRENLRLWYLSNMFAKVLFPLLLVGSIRRRR